MSFNRAERLIINSKEQSVSSGDVKGALSHLPSTRNMDDGEQVYARQSNKPLALYKKFKGVLWKSYFLKDGNQVVDNNINIGGSYQMNGLDIIDHEGYQVGILKTRQIVSFGYDASLSAGAGATTTADAKAENGATNGQGFRMIRDGKVTGLSMQYDCTTSGGGSFTATVQKNASNQSMNVSGAINATGDKGVSTTSNPLTVSAGDRVNVELTIQETDGSGTIAVDDIAVFVELET